MSGDFVMGATLQMRDMFSRGIRTATQATQMFRGVTQTADQATGRWRDSQGRLNSTLGQFDRQVDNSTRNTREYAQASSGLASGLGTVKTAILAVASAAAVKVGFDWLVGSNADMETYKNTLAVVLKSEEKAVETLAWAQKFAAKTPFEIPQIVEATTRMASYGLNAQKTLGIVGDMASVMGKDLMQAVEAVADAQTGELERLKEFGITKKQIEAQAKLMKVTVTNSQGQITDQKAFNAVLFKLMEDRYKGGMEMQSKTFRGMVSNVKDFVGTIGRTVGKPIFDGMKNQLSGLLGWLNRVQENGQVEKWANDVTWLVGAAGDAFTRFKQKVAGPIDYVIYGVKALYIKNKPFLDSLALRLGTLFKSLQTSAGPVFNWLLYTALPKLIGFLLDVGQKIIDVANYIDTNWSWIQPLVEGIAWALGIYVIYLGLVKTMTMTATAMQWLWNAAMSANPMGLVIIGIGLLIGAGILLYKNFDTIKDKVADMWVSMKDSFKTGVNYVIDKINWLIEKIRLVPGFGDTPLIARMQTTTDQINSAKAAGYTDNWVNGSYANGLSYVPFDGFRAELHKGERVLTADENRDYGGKSGGSSIGTLIGQLSINGTDKSVSEIADAVVDKLYDVFSGANDIAGAGMEVLL